MPQRIRDAVDAAVRAANESGLDFFASELHSVRSQEPEVVAVKLESIKTLLRLRPAAGLDTALVEIERLTATK